MLAEISVLVGNDHGHAVLLLRMMANAHEDRLKITRDVCIFSVLVTKKYSLGALLHLKNIRAVIIVLSEDRDGFETAAFFHDGRVLHCQRSTVSYVAAVRLDKSDV